MLEKSPTYTIFGFTIEYLAHKATPSTLTGEGVTFLHFLLHLLHHLDLIVQHPRVNYPICNPLCSSTAKSHQRGHARHAKLDSKVKHIAVARAGRIELDFCKCKMRILVFGSWRAEEAERGMAQNVPGLSRVASLTFLVSSLWSTRRLRLGRLSEDYKKGVYKAIVQQIVCEAQ